MSDLAKLLKERDGKHLEELKKEQDEVSRLKTQLEELKKTHKAEIEDLVASSHQTITEEKERLEGEAQKHKDLLAKAETLATSTQKELDELKGKAKIWQSELTRINGEMASKLFHLQLLFSADINYMPTYALIRHISCFSPEDFPHSELSAKTAVSKVRRKRAESGPIDETWTVEDHLAALSARLNPLKIIGVDVLNAAIHTFRALWPGVEPPTSVADLVEWLKTSDDRLNEWRESAARVGADEALSFVLSWYEDITLESLQTMRVNGKYVTDPELIKKRQERAYSFIPYANIHTFVADPNAGEENGEEAKGEIEGEDNTEADAPSAGTGEPGTGNDAPSAEASGSGTAA